MMKKLKLILWVLVIVLASVGITLVGGIPILPVYKKDDGSEIKIELFEPQEDEDDSDIPEIKL